MTDIVERLRGPSPSILAMRDAADEIERLRRALKVIHTWASVERPLDPTHIRELAHFALYLNKENSDE